MANINDLLGAFMQGNLAPSGANRLGGALEQLQRGLGGAGAAASGGSGNLLGGLLKSAIKSGLGGAGAGAGAGGMGAGGGGLGALAGALFGGGGGGQSGARAGDGANPGLGAGAGLGALTVIAGIAMQALQAHAQKAGAGPVDPGKAAPGQSAGGPGAATGFGANMGVPGPWSGGDLPVALRQPRNAAEQGALEDTARLVIEGMINAAKADGQVSPEEMQRIVGKLGDAGSDPALQQWVMAVLAAPLDVRAFGAAIPNQEVAAEVYAASLLAIEVDTEAERAYLRNLAVASGLHPLVVGQIHRTLGVPAPA